MREGAVFEEGAVEASELVRTAVGVPVPRAEDS